jgi:biopolymer transport protein ExbD
MALGKVPVDDGSGGEDGIFAEINITPLTDIFLVLLIIFMVSSTVMVSKARDAQRTGLTVNLPSGTRKEIPEKVANMIVEISPTGDIVADTQPVKRDQIKNLFATRFKNAPDTQVILRADKTTPHGFVVEVIEAAKDVGLKNIAIATKSSQ